MPPLSSICWHTASWIGRSSPFEFVLNGFLLRTEGVEPGVFGVFFDELFPLAGVDLVLLDGVALVLLDGVSLGFDATLGGRDAVAETSFGTSGLDLPTRRGAAAVPLSPDVSRELHELASSSDNLLPRFGELCDRCATPLLVDSPKLTREGRGISVCCSSSHVLFLVFFTTQKKVRARVVFLLVFLNCMLNCS